MGTKGHMPIMVLGNPILSQKAEEVEEVNKEIHSLIDKMIDSMTNCKGAGLAAPQLGESKRVFICMDEKGKIHPFINPEIVEESVEDCLFQEGCLSVPGVQVKIWRPQRVTVEYTKRNGERVRQEFDGLLARVIQHEFDHLEGIIFIERLPERERTGAYARAKKMLS